MRKIIILGHTSRIFNGVGYKVKDFEFLKYDIRNLNYKYNTNSEIILNFASANPTSQDKLDFFSQNVKIANNIVSLALKVKAKKIINISAMSIFNGVKYELVNGLSEPAPNDEYSISKLQMENIFKKSGVETVVNVRIPGVENIGNIGTLFGRFRHAISNNQDVLYFNGDKLTNNVIDCNNLHGFILAILNSNINKSVNFNLGSKNPIKIVEVLQLMKLRYKSRSRLVEYKSPNNSFHIDLSEELKIYNLSNTYEYI